MRDAWKRKKVTCEDHPLPMMKANGTTNVWISDEPSFEHFCEPKKRSEIGGLATRRSIQAQLATGSQENTASAVVRTEKKILTKFANESQEFRHEARQVSVANRPALSKAFYRARSKQFPLVADFQDVMTEENFLLRCTERGSIPQHEKYGEQLLLFGDNQMLIFFSPRQQFWFSLSREIVCDGNYKYKPVGSYEVYRIFGYVKKIHSTPLVTAFLKNKDKKTFRKMWRKIAGAMSAQIKLQVAHFDHESAAHGTFKNQFPDVNIKMCAFHVKQNLNKQVQTKGLAVDYRENREVQDVVRMLGALQLAPSDVWPHSIIAIRHRIQERFNLLDAIVGKLNQLVEYFNNTWLSLGEFFSLHGIKGQRTTNAAESYHGKLRHHFRTNCPLGEWIVRFKELQSAEEENASDVNHGRQAPRKQARESVELSAKIASAQEEFAVVLASQADDDAFEEKLCDFLLTIGYLMGYNNQPAPTYGPEGEPIPAPATEEIDPEEEERNAVANIPENLFEDPNNIHLFD